MKRKDLFFRIAVLRNEGKCYLLQSKLVDKRTEVPLNWRSLPVQEQQNLLH